MNQTCEPCGSALQHNRAHGGKPASWQCAWCLRAGAYRIYHVAGRKVVVRDVVHEGDPSMRRDWVPAESVPYAGRVS